MAAAMMVEGEEPEGEVVASEEIDMVWSDILHWDVDEDGDMQLDLAELAGFEGGSPCPLDTLNAFVFDSNAVPNYVQMSSSASASSEADVTEEQSAETMADSPQTNNFVFNVQGLYVGSVEATDDVVYTHLAALRVEQQRQGWDLRQLSPVQMGKKLLERVHHVTMNQTIKGGPLSHRVRVCKRCCGEDAHIELGTYLDQESAMLMNDAYEIIHGRFAKLLVLVPSDEPWLGLLKARRYNRGKVEEKGVLEIIREREMERDQRKSFVSSKHKRRRAASSADDDMYVLGSGKQQQSRTVYSDTPATLLTIPSRPLIDISDALVEKLSPVLDRMSYLLAFSFQKNDVGKFNQIFRRVFSKVITPQPSMSSVSDRKEWALTSTSMVLLTSYLCPQDADVRLLLDKLGNLCPKEEPIESFVQLSELMESIQSANDKFSLPSATQLNHVVNLFLAESKMLLWQSVYKAKLPRFSKDAPGVSNEDIVSETLRLVATMDRKRHILAQLCHSLHAFAMKLTGSSDVCSGVRMCEEDSEDIPRTLLQNSRWLLTVFAVGVGSLRSRLYDMTGNLELIDMTIDMLREVQQMTHTASLQERFDLLVLLLALYNTRHRARQTFVVTSPIPSKAVQDIFNELMEVSEALGYLPNYSAELPEHLKGAFDQGEIMRIGESSLASETYHVFRNELKCVLYGYLMEYSFFHDGQIAWPDGIQFQDILGDFKETLRRVQDDAVQRGVLFIRPCSWRALFVGMDVSNLVTKKANKSLPCAYGLAQMCMTILEECTSRFEYASVYATRAAAIMRELDTLQGQALNEISGH